MTGEMFTSAFAGLMGLPPEMVTTGVSVKSKPVSTMSILSRDPSTATVPVAPIPVESEIESLGGLTTSYPVPPPVTLKLLIGP